jgi:hypothetical protein
MTIRNLYIHVAIFVQLSLTEPASILDFSPLILTRLRQDISYSSMHAQFLQFHYNCCSEASCNLGKEILHGLQQVRLLNLTLEAGVVESLRINF